MKCFLKGHSGFEENKAIPLHYPVAEMNQRYIHILQFTVRFVGSCYIKEVLDCFLKEPSSMRQGKDKRYIRWIHNMNFSKKKKKKKDRHICFANKEHLWKTCLFRAQLKPLCNSYNIPGWWLKRDRIYNHDKSLIFRGWKQEDTFLSSSVC